MKGVTPNEALNTVMQLPVEQQEMLLDIVHSCQIENRRREMTQDTQTSIAAFRAGELRPQSAADVISELRQFLAEEEE